MPLATNIHSTSSNFRAVLGGFVVRQDFLKSIPNELAKLAGAVNEAMQLTDLVPWARDERGERNSTRAK